MRLRDASRPLRVALVTETFPPEINGVAMTLGRLADGLQRRGHAYCRHYGLGWLKRPIAHYLRHIHNATDLTLVPTQNLARQLAEQGYRNVRVLSRGVDVRLFNSARRSEALRASWGAGPGDLVVTYVGRIAAEKNLGLVLAAFAAIEKAVPNAKLVFAGMRRGVELAGHYASGDLFLFPSLTETFGNVTAEALASGLGVVAYACAAAGDLIEDGSNGRLAAPGDAAGFIDAAVSLASHPQQLALTRALAAPSVGHLDWERIHDDFADGLRRCIATHKRRIHGKNVLVAALD